MRDFVLCRGRHDFPCHEYIFDYVSKPMDLWGLEHQANKKIIMIEDEHIGIYVTGLTTALIAALNACRRHKKKVTLYQYDRDLDTYRPQEVL